MKKFRCSQLSNLVKVPQKKGETLSETAKSAVLDTVKQDKFGFHSFLGNVKTRKGVMLEQQAIGLSSLLDYQRYEKNTVRKENDLIAGECDIFDAENRRIIDIKCAWDIGSHPFFKSEAEKKTLSSGYDWQMQGYMWLYDCDITEIHYWLLPCPDELLPHYDDREQLIDLVNQIELRERRTVHKIERDEKMIERIKEIIPHCQSFYRELLLELNHG